ncbi:MAG TPA: pyrroline-5-carboxylate reductase [Acidimicrobiia bacterium]|nr:pyrroline-5-carboxylate reductase [Acidimicrobiia bacterium]
MTTRPTVAVVGVGAMGEALAAGLLNAGWEPSELTLVVRRPERVAQLQQRTGIEVSLTPRDAASRDVVVISVKPRDVAELLEELKSALRPGQVLLSIAAGVPTSTYESALGDVAVVRAMPNTPALVKEAVTGMAAGRYAGAEELEKARLVLEAVGGVQQLDEGLLDAVTAVSGTGPAYVFLLAEALTEAAVREGLPRDIAESFVNQTIRGAGHLLTETARGPFELRSQVTSPGGTTAAAVHVLEERGFRALVEDAVRAAAQRARELGSA